MNHRCQTILYFTFLVSSSFLFSDETFSQEKVVPKSLQRLHELLESTEIQNEIGMVKSQFEDLKPIRAELRRDYQTMRTKMIQAESEEERQKIRKEISIILGKAKQEIQRHLLPHQVTRLRQIDYQKSNFALSDSSFGMLRIGDRLGLSDSQRSEIGKFVEANDGKFLRRVENLKTDIETFREKLREEILDELDYEQRAAYEKDIGPEYLRAFWIAHWFSRSLGLKKQ